MRALPTRRLVLRLLAGASALLPGAALPQDAPRDQGIGGTGMMRTDAPRDGAPGEGDRGIGGTGVIGTIRGFGSILINGLRIAYPTDVGVFIDGEPGKVADLKVGHVVRVVARPEGADLTTRRIDVTSEVVGPVEQAGPGRLRVLGQRVSTAGLSGDWKAGERVAVSGLRRPDGVIVASLIEPRASGPARVAGPVRRDADGGLRIGELRLARADGLTPGRRALVTGDAADEVLRVTNAASLAFPSGLRQASIEAYIGRVGTGLDLGSGIAVAGRAGASVPRRGSVRAVLTANVASDGVLTADRLRIEDRTAPQAPQGPEVPRFERERDRIDLRGLPGERRGAFGGGEPRGPVIDTWPDVGGIPGGGRRYGEGTPGGAIGIGPSGGPGAPGGAGPGFGGPGPGRGGFGGGGGGPGGPGGGFGGPGRGR